MMIDGYVAEILNNQIMNEINAKKATDKEKLIEKDIKSIENRVRHAFNQGYELGLNHGKKQEPKTGHWIEKDDNLYECSECGQYIYSETEHDLLEFHAFCGRCGAKMESEVKEC